MRYIILKKSSIWLRLLTALLALLMVAAMAVACSDNKDPNKDPSKDPSDDPGKTDPSDSSDPSDDEVKDDLPNDKNYGGREFKILYNRDTLVGCFWVDAETGSVVDKAVYDACAITEERFGVKLIAESSSQTDPGHANLIQTAISTGDNVADLFQVHDVLGANLSLQGMFLDVHSLPYVDLSKPWWPAKTVDSLSFMGQWYLISSSMSYNSIAGASVLFFNKDMMNDLSMEEPYQRVLDGNWYLEDMLSEVQDIYTDVTTDGKTEDDTFGIIIPREFYSWYESFGISMIEKKADGDELKLNANDDRAYDLIDALYGILYESDGGHMLARLEAEALFAEGRALYIPTRLRAAVETFATYEINYGIVPYPKLDENQEGYYAGYTDFYFVVPNYCDDKELMGIILESMTAEGYRKVIPTYFETALKGRYTRDPESKEVLDIIQKNMVIDFAYAYGNDKWYSRALYQLLKEQSKDYASFYKTNENAALARIDEVVTAFRDLANK